MKNLMLIVAVAIGSMLLMSVAEVQAGEFVPPFRERGSTSVSVANFGAVANDGKADNDAFQKAIDSLPKEGGTVNVPSGVFHIDVSNDSAGVSKSIFLRSRMHLKMHSDTIIKTMTNDLDASAVFSAILVHDVTISGGNVMGDRDTHLITEGEHGYGLLLRGAKRITIRDIKFADHFGDGICIGAYKVKPDPLLLSKTSNDVVIYNVVATRNRRQALTIANATNIKVYNSEFSYTEGTAPQFGIDIEPDDFSSGIPTANYARGIEIVNSKFHHNKGGGVQLWNRTKDITIQGNLFSYNGLGVYSAGTNNASIINNTIKHNRKKGVSLRHGAHNVVVDNNILRNNSTDNVGINLDPLPLHSVEGMDETIANEVGTSDDTSMIKIMTNYYEESPQPQE
jgi:parallel beta-helix repeat protein